MVKPIITSFLIFFSAGHSVFGQIKDSIGVAVSNDSTVVTISKVNSAEKGNDLYEITIENLKDTPICIMFSPEIKLFYDPPQHLAFYKLIDYSLEIVSLHYSEADSHIDYEGPNADYDAEPILPFQHITFRVYIPSTDFPLRMIFDYIILRNFCYNDFKQAIFRNSSTWYEGYIIKHMKCDLPR